MPIDVAKALPLFFYFSYGEVAEVSRNIISESNDPMLAIKAAAATTSLVDFFFTTS